MKKDKKKLLSMKKNGKKLSGCSLVAALSPIFDMIC